jgi:toxin ParE1/3/4
VKVRITLQAAGHLNAVHEYLHAISPRVAVAQMKLIFRAIDRLKQFPQAGHVGRLEGTREMMVPRTPFLVVYSLRGEQINILAILHGSQQWPRQS